MSEFRLADLGEGLHEAELISWHVEVGDHVVADQPIASVETDKAVVEIPSPQSGRIARLHGTPGDIIEVGDRLIEFADEAGPDAGTVVGRVPRPARSGGDRVARASPAARNLARRLGVTLAGLDGSGPDGVVTVQDVERAAGEAAAAAEGRPGPDIRPMRGVRRAMSVNMAEAGAEVVPATVNDLAAIDRWAGGQDVTLRLVRAIARACESEPALNAWYLGLEKGRVMNERVDLGIAMDTEAGLFVPVLRDVARRKLADIRRGIEAMKADVRSRKVPLEELRGQTITLSNFGMFGGRFAALVVLPPQVAIVGAGRVHDAVVPRDGKATVTRVLPISLTFDHRAVMGGEAARFLATLIADLEKPQ